MTFRILLFLVLTALISLGINWIVVNNGEINMIWLGYQVTTSVAFVIFSLIFIIVILMILLQLLYALITFPSRINKKLKAYQLEQNLKNLQVGYAALLSGDFDQARKISVKLIDVPSRNKSVENLSQMLIAKVAQEDGNKQLADDYFDKFMAKGNTRFFAIKGKLDTAFKAGEVDEAISFAEEAYRIKPSIKDGAHSLLELYKKANKPDKAEEFLIRYKNKHRIFKDRYNTIDVDKELANIWYIKAKDIYDNSDGFKNTYERALKSVNRALGIFPYKQEYLILALRICKQLKNEKYARIATEKAWKSAQSVELGAIYLETISAPTSKESTKKKLKAIEALSRISFNNEIIERLKDRIYDIQIEY